MLLDKESYEEIFNDKDSISKISYRAIKRYGKKGFTEIGVINYLSQRLVENNLRILYLSTYLDAFMLIQLNDFGIAHGLLKQQQNILIEEEN